MARITLPYATLGARRFPDACIVCGAPPAGHYPRKLSRAYKNPSTGRYEKSLFVEFNAPLCETHRRPWERGWLANGAIVLLLVAFIGGLLTGGTGVLAGAYAGIAALAVMTVVVLLTAPPVRFTVNSWVGPTSITLIGVSRQFANRLNEENRRASTGHPPGGTAAPPSGGARVKRLAGRILRAAGTGFMVLGGLVVAATVKSSWDRPRVDESSRPEPWDSREDAIARLVRRRDEIEAERSRREWATTIVIVMGSVVGVGGGLMNRLGKRLAAKGADEAEQNDPRPPVLLLRSFADDAGRLGYLIEARPRFLPPVTGNYVSQEQVSFEELITEVLAGAGPVVAIGRPGETLPPPGAARRWVRYEEWQAHVLDYLGRCRFVAMILGAIRGEDGLAWELRRVLEQVPPERILFVVPPVEEAEARERWAAFAERCGGRLPPYQGGELAAGFDAGWHCTVIRADGPRFRLSSAYGETLASLIRGRSAQGNGPGGTARVPAPVNVGLGAGPRFPL